MDVFVANEQHLPADEARLSELARHTLSSEDIEAAAELSVLLVTSDHMKQLNSRFAGDDHATDVLAFPMADDEEEDDLLLGDVVICPEVARSNAEKMDHSLQAELEVLLVHGTLHLLGYDHQEEEDTLRMTERTEEVLASFPSTPR